MPTSWYQAIPLILDKILQEHPQSILDVGIGFGKYGVLLREALDVSREKYRKKDWTVQIDGVEAFKSYRNPIHDYIYNRIYYDSIENVLPDLGSYDVIAMIDVLEHFDKDRGKIIIQHLLRHTRKALLISTPINPNYQEEYMGNTFEAHKSRWTVTDFTNYKMDYTFLDIGENRALLVKIYPNDIILQKSKNIFIKDSLFLQSLKTNPTKREPKLRIAYVLPHQNLTGGLKMLLEQIYWMKARGHKVDVYLKGCSEITSALPDWDKIEVDRDVVIPFEQPYKNYIKDCDVIVAGLVEQLAELSECDAPVLYWEQGHELLFGDFKNSSLTPQLQLLMDTMYSVPCAITAASDYVAETLKFRFGRAASVIPNGVDSTLYYPGTPPDENIVLLVGNPALQFKGFDFALRALNLAWKNGARFRVRWVCQMAPDVHGITFPLQYVVNPSQKKLADQYRRADLFLFTSWYEGFGMPPLEAMASGLPVICTECGGSAMYLRPMINALTATPGNIPVLAAAVSNLLLDKDLRKSLSKHGRETALEFSVENTCTKLEQVLYHIKQYGYK